LVRHGSHAYGTNVATSDEDFKGVCIPPKQYYYGMLQHFEQAELKDPDSVIYEIRKFFNLAAASNPNIIEVLHVDPSDYVLVSPIGEIILEHRDEFLSKRVKHSFLGYAYSQFARMTRHRQWLVNPPKEPPTRKEMGLPEQTLIPQDQLMAAQAEIQKEMDRFQFDWMEELSEPMKISIRNVMSEMLAELKITSEQHWMAAARKVGLNDNFIEIMQRERAYTSKKREWDQYQNWKQNRNPERAADEAKYGCDLKHAYHLVRLTRMSREILLTGKVIVKRPDREELLAIRNGAWNYDRIAAFVEKEEKELNTLYDTANLLPKTPDMKKLDELCIQLVEGALSA
jgi:predicted nucleotidyltransferase